MKRFDLHKDKNGVVIEEGQTVKVNGDSFDRNNYSLVTKYNGELVIFGRLLGSWVFLSNKEFICPYLEVISL